MDGNNDGEPCEQRGAIDPAAVRACSVSPHPPHCGAARRAERSTNRLNSRFHAFSGFPMDLVRRSRHRHRRRFRPRLRGRRASRRPWRQSRLVRCQRRKRLQRPPSATPTPVFSHRCQRRSGRGRECRRRKSIRPDANVAINCAGILGAGRRAGKRRRDALLRPDSNDGDGELSAASTSPKPPAPHRCSTTMRMPTANAA